MDHLSKVEVWLMGNGIAATDAPPPTAPVAERYVWLEDAYDMLGDAAEAAHEYHVADDLFLLATMYGRLAVEPAIAAGI